MYFSLNEERIISHFNPYPYVRVAGPDKLYYVEMREYVDNDDKSLVIDGYKIAPIDIGWRTFMYKLNFTEILKSLFQNIFQITD